MNPTELHEIHQLEEVWHLVDELGRLSLELQQAAAAAQTATTPCAQEKPNDTL